MDQVCSAVSRVVLQWMSTIAGLIAGTVKRVLKYQRHGILKLVDRKISGQHTGCRDWKRQAKVMLKLSQGCHFKEVGVVMHHAWLNQRISSCLVASGRKFGRSSQKNTCRFWSSVEAQCISCWRKELASLKEVNGSSLRRTMMQSTKGFGGVMHTVNVLQVCYSWRNCKENISGASHHLLMRDMVKRVQAVYCELLVLVCLLRELDKGLVSKRFMTRWSCEGCYVVIQSRDRWSQGWMVKHMAE